jgi:hypothetical protein
MGRDSVDDKLQVETDRPGLGGRWHCFDCLPLLMSVAGLENPRKPRGMALSGRRREEADPPSPPRTYSPIR